jgi:hypothetical protein
MPALFQPGRGSAREKAIALPVRRPNGRGCIKVELNTDP